jgi:hypothetical protein
MATKFTYKMRSEGKWDVGSETRLETKNFFLGSDLNYDKNVGKFNS